MVPPLNEKKTRTRRNGIARGNKLARLSPCSLVKFTIVVWLEVSVTDFPLWKSACPEIAEGEIEGDF